MSRLAIFQLPDEPAEISRLPATLGFDFLGQWETIIVFKSAWKGIVINGRAVKLRPARSGHPLIKLLDGLDECAAMSSTGSTMHEAESSAGPRRANANPQYQVDPPTLLVTTEVDEPRLVPLPIP